MEMEEVPEASAELDPKVEIVDVYRPEADPELREFYVAIPDFESLTEEKRRSEVHEIAGYKWRLLLFPKGNDTKNSLSLYLECEGPVNTDEQYPIRKWRFPASFKLIVCSQGPESVDIVQETRHIFSHNDTDWGFREIVSFDILYSENESYIVNGALKLGSSISIENSEEYDSRKETGFNGIKNLGATCYLNSLLQVLFTLGDFRKSVFGMELPADDDDDKIPFALQKVFYELQNGAAPVKTKRLTKSFGWDSSDAFTQQDLHELNRLLCSHLEEAMKKQNAKNKISELFEGKLVNFIQCVNIDYTSTRDEAFFDLNLTVQGSKTIYESFDKYLEVEMLDGDNKYRAEGYEDLQDAKRGVKFSTLPPVLQLHLKRFEFDYVRGINVKINDRLEFPGELDLRNYVEKSSGNEVYSLHSVLVHVGDVHAGHYYVYIRPFAETNQWYKFDDETVTLVNEKEAIDENFGSPTPRKLSNAYMLQYVQKDKAKSLLKKVETVDVPKALEERILLDAEEEENRRRERDDFHLFMDVAIVREESLLSHNGVDLIPWDSAERLDRRLIRKSMLFRELAELVTGHLGLDSHQTLRVWRLCQRQNSTIRPDRLLTSGDDDVPLSKLSGLGSELQLLLQTVPKSEVEAMETDEVLQFFKVFAPKPIPILACIGSLACNRSATVKHSIQQLMKLKPVPRELVLAVQAGNITVFEEDTPQPVKPIDIEKTHDELGLGTGDIIVIQLPPSVLLESLPPSILEKRSTPLQGMHDVKTASDYFMYLRNRIHVEFRDLQKPAESGIMLELLKTDTYGQTRKALSHALGVGSSPDKIRLYPFDIVTNGPRQDSLSLAQLNSRGDSLENMLEMDYRPGGYTTMESKIFWYEYIDYDLEEFENKEEVRITWRYDGGTYIQGASTGIPEIKDRWMRTKVLSVLVPFHTSTYEDVTREMKKKLGIPSEIPIRVVEVKSSYVCRVVPLSELVPHVVHLPSTGAQLDYELRAEPDVLDDVDRHHLGRGEYSWVSVLHIPRGNYLASRGYFGDPFLLPVKAEGEKVGVLRERIRIKVRVKEEEFDNWALFSITVSSTDALDDVESTWSVGSDEIGSTSLAIEHTRRVPPKRTYGLMKYDKPLVIKS